MAMRTRSPLALTLALALAVLAAVSPAAARAADSNGAMVGKVDDCQVFGEGFRLCFKIRSVSHETATPSGNVVYVSNSRWSYTFTDPAGALLGEGGTKSHFRTHTRDEVLERLSSQSTVVLSFDGITCVSRTVFRAVGDEVVVDRYENECR